MVKPSQRLLEMARFYFVLDEKRHGKDRWSII